MMNIHEMDEIEFISLLQKVSEESTLRYGSLKKALHISGIASSPNQVYSNDEIYAQLKKVESENGYVSQAIYEKSKCRPTIRGITSRFGTLAAACELAGVKFIPNKPKVGSEGKKKGKSYKDKQIIDALKSASKIYGGSLTIKQYKESGLKPSYMTILKRYHSFQVACQEAGVEYIRYNPRDIKIEQIATILRDILLTAGKLLTTTEYIEAGHSPHVATIYKHGITWVEAIELARQSKLSGELIQKSSETSDN
ncbi:hypothetical protein [Paenibacillus sp. HW567]|uniref:hypothetical protein n=1 Tax=Paenibacillus sp. HW567 TaxID=1034769 RepID=UPI00039F98ED|nr:hypothetical protein [Paenibacillus sp. HW567]